MSLGIDHHFFDDPETGMAGFLDRILLGVYRSSIEGKLVFGNRALAQIFGFDSVREMRRYPLVSLYRSKQDRGEFIRSLVRENVVEGRLIGFRRKDGTPIWCSVNAASVADSEGNVAFIDGTVRDVTEEKEQRETLQRLADMIRSRREFPFSLDDAGRIVEIEPSGARLLGRQPEEMIAVPLSVFVAKKYRKLLDGFLADVWEKGAVEGILPFMERGGGIRHLEIHAQRVDPKEGKGRIDGMARDITRTVESQKERLNRERFQGVLEMAGGVVHRLNQPLTVALNLVNELVAESTPDDPQSAKLRQVREQVMKLNEIAKKIGNIRKYKSMDYVAGVRIVDIDQAS